MHIKFKYIQAIEDAIDFINHNSDGASEEQNESETLHILREIATKMNKNHNKQLVNYFVRKNNKTTKQ